MLALVFPEPHLICVSCCEFIKLSYICAGWVGAEIWFDLKVDLARRQPQSIYSINKLDLETLHIANIRLQEFLEFLPFSYPANPFSDMVIFARRIM